MSRRQNPPDNPLSKTLDELEGIVWGPPTYPSHLVTTVCRLRTMPLSQFTVEDLRIMIGQKISLPYLIPLAIEVLEQEPLASGDYYAGDLLSNVAGAAEWLRQHPDLCRRVEQIAWRALEALDDTDRHLERTLFQFLKRCESRVPD